MKKITVAILLIQVIALQSAFASKGRGVTRFFQTETGKQLLNRLSQSSQGKRAAPHEANKLSLDREKEAALRAAQEEPSKEGSLTENILGLNESRGANKAPNKPSIGALPSGSSDSVAEDIFVEIETAIENGDIDAYRANIVKLLDVPYRIILEQTKNSEIFNRTAAYDEMMKNHPNESVRMPFRFEFEYAERAMIRNVRNDRPLESWTGEGYEEYKKFREEKNSIYRQYIPEIVLEDTKFGRAIRQRSIPRRWRRKQFLNSGNKTLSKYLIDFMKSDPSFRDVLAYQWATVKTPELHFLVSRIC